MSMGWALGLRLGLWAFVGRFPWAQQGHFPWDLVASFLGAVPLVLLDHFLTKRSGACWGRERSDEVRDCKVHITQIQRCT